MSLAVAARATYLNCAFRPGFWSGDTPPTQFYDAVNFTKFEIKAQTQEADSLVSNRDGDFGENLAQVQKPTEAAALSAEADYMSPQMLALLLGADLSEVTQSTSTVTDEAVTPAQGLWIPLANKYISTFSAKTSGDVVVDPANYSVDLVSGLFKALNATGATVAKVSYTVTARTIETHKAGKAKSAYLKFVGTGTEKVSQTRCLIIVHKASLAASGAFDVVAGGYLKGAFSGGLITPSTETSPWQAEFTDLATA